MPSSEYGCSHGRQLHRTPPTTFMKEDFVHVCGSDFSQSDFKALLGFSYLSSNNQGIVFTSLYCVLSTMETKRFINPSARLEPETFESSAPPSPRDPISRCSGPCGFSPHPSPPDFLTVWPSAGPLCFLPRLLQKLPGASLPPVPTYNPRHLLPKYKAARSLQDLETVSVSDCL